MARVSARQILAYRMELTAWFGLAIFIVGLIAQIIAAAASYVFFMEWLNSNSGSLQYENPGLISWILPTLAGLVPPIVAFAVGEKNAKPRTKYEHMYNGVLFVFLAIWLNAALATFLPALFSQAPTPEYAQYVPQATVLAIVILLALLYGKKYKKVPLHDFRAYQLLLIGSIGALFIFTTIAFFAYSQGQLIETLAIGVMGMLISAGMIAVPYVFSGEKQRMTRLTHACIAGSIGIWSLGAIATLPLYLSQLDSLQVLLPSVVGLAAWLVYIYLLHRHSA